MKRGRWTALFFAKAFARLYLRPETDGMTLTIFSVRRAARPSIFPRLRRNPRSSIEDFNELCGRAVQRVGKAKEHSERWGGQTSLEVADDGRAGARSLGELSLCEFSLDT
jgi:hypothetical protein